MITDAMAREIGDRSAAAVKENHVVATRVDRTIELRDGLERLIKFV